MEFARASGSPEQTLSIGQQLARVLRGGDIVLLDGPLGAGKTVLVRGIASGLGVDPSRVSSPTYVVIHEYRRGDGAASRERPELIHVDAYRLSGAAELETLGWDRVMRALDLGVAAAVVEWAERLGGEAWLEGRGAARVRMEATGESTRRIECVLPREWAGREGVGELAAREAARCPITGRMVPPDSPTYPFADERARLADLYRWFSGAYGVSRPLHERDLEEGE